MSQSTNPTILSVYTETHGRVHVRADAILVGPKPMYSSGSNPQDLWAMSIIGPDQAVRAIGAGCALANEYGRTILTFVGPKGRRLVTRWNSSWNCRAQVLTDGILHMVAMPAVSVTAEEMAKAGRRNKKLQTKHLIVPPPGVSVSRALYERLLLSYSTPLLSIGTPGQPAWEAEAAQDWMQELTKAIMDDESLWRFLEGHPEQSDKRWDGAGLLTMEEEELDTLVGTMVRNRRLRIPIRTTAA